MLAAEKMDYDVMYSIDGVHETFIIRYASNLQRSLLYFSLVYTVLYGQPPTSSVEGKQERPQSRDNYLSGSSGPGSVLLAGKDFVCLVMKEAVHCSELEYHQLSHQLTLRLSLESVRGLMAKYKNNMSCFFGELPSKPLFPPTILYKIILCTQTFSHHQADKYRWWSPFQGIQLL